MIHHSAWIARRWSDPTFPINFPWFASPAYWADQCTRIGEQLEAMAEPPLGAGVPRGMARGAHDARAHDAPARRDARRAHSRHHTRTASASSRDELAIRRAAALTRRT